MHVLVIAGAAGTGKTTLGRALARELRLPLIDLDTLTEPLLNGLTRATGADAAGAEATVPEATAGWLPRGDHWNATEHRALVRPARYAALYAAIADQVQTGVGAVAVAPFTAELAGGTEWHALVSASGGLPTVIHLTASAELIAARRQQRGFDRDAHAMAAPQAAPQVPTLELDAALTTAGQLARIRRHLGLHAPLPADSPVFSREFRAGLADLDGTLIDSTPAVVRSWARLSAELQYEGDMLAEGHGRPALQVLQMLLPPETVEGAYRRIEEIEVSEVADVIPIAGSLPLFASLPKRAIVTSGTHAIASSRITAAEVPLPPVLVTFTDVTRGKPDPEPFLLAAQRLGVPADSCVVFEDAPAGITAARAAGCAVVAITGTHDASELADADLIVDRLDQLEVELLGDGRFRLRPRG